MYKDLFVQCRLFIVSVLAIILVACGVSSSGPSLGGGSSIVPNGDTNLGVLANGSIVYSSSATYTVANNNYVTGTIGLTGGTFGYFGILSFNVLQGNNNFNQQTNNVNGLVLVETNPGTCILNSLDPESTCQLIINGDGANPGTYIVTPTITGEGGEQKLNSFIVTVTNGGSSFVLGNLAINLAKNAIQVNTSTTATVSLSNSSNIDNLKVILSSISSPSNVVTINPDTCLLSSKNNRCKKITITGKEPGNAQIIATGIMGKQQVLIANKQLVVGSNPGTITLSLKPKIISKNESTIATITLHDGANIVNNVKINVVSSNTSVADVVGSGSCTILTSEAPDNTCTVPIQAKKLGETTITATRQDMRSNSAAAALSVSRSIFFIGDYYSGELGGISGADAGCNVSRYQSIYGGQYKAFLTDGESRIACTSPNCEKGGISEHVDWVLQPSTIYVFHMTKFTSVSRITNKNGLFLNQSGQVANNLGTSDFPSPNKDSWNIKFWTGFGGDYLSNGQDCKKWFSAESLAQGDDGLTKNDISANVLYQNFDIQLDYLDAGLNCGDFVAYIMCVQQ